MGVYLEAERGGEAGCTLVGLGSSKNIAGEERSVRPPYLIQGFQDPNHPQPRCLPLTISQHTIQPFPSSMTQGRPRRQSPRAPQTKGPHLNRSPLHAGTEASGWLLAPPHVVQPRFDTAFP